MQLNPYLPRAVGRRHGEAALQKTFWAAGGFGMLADRFGTHWMVNCEKAG